MKLICYFSQIQTSLGGENMATEVQTYLSVLNDLRDQVKKLLEGFPREALDWRPIQGEGDLATNSPAVLATHLAGSEIQWMKEVIGGKPIQRDRDAEFRTKGKTLAELQAGLDSAAQATREVLSSLKPAQMDETRRRRDRDVTVRWSILHVIEHFAVHLGHLQLTRQCWMAKK
jgi:uncharacterized damage-inducible protein DinB